MLACNMQAILGAHGFKAHEVYDPVWRHVHVPEQFLSLVCPMAEGIHAEIVGAYTSRISWEKKSFR
jgi:hypothetical protein